VVARGAGDGKESKKRQLLGLASMLTSSFSFLLPLSLSFSDSLARRRGHPEVLSAWTLRRRLGDALKP
jgi:hypothetical protein